MSIDTNISFYSGEHLITGLLRQPESQEQDIQKPYPVVILLNGSERETPITSAFYIEISDALLEAGIASLITNKRGVGGSSGNWWRNTFQDRADDTLAAVQYLKGLPQVDPHRVGILGHSQGGYISQLVASMSNEVAFIVNSAGPGETIYEQIITDVTNRYEALNNPNYLISARLLPIKLLLRLLKITNSVLRIHPLSYIIQYDPKPALRRISCPTLAMFGELDVLAPPRVNIPIIEACFKQSGNQNNLTILTLPNVGHSFRNDHKFVPEYLSSIVKWIKQQLK